MTKKRTKGQKAKGKGPSTPRASVRSDVGVLFVHGIGKQEEGRVLDAFGDPVRDSIAGRLMGGGTLVEKECDGCKIAGKHRHFVTSEMEGESACLTSWVFAECYWDDVINRVDVPNFNGWIARVLPMLIMWQMASSAIGGFHRRIHEGQALNPLAWYSWLCSLFWSTVIRAPLAYFALTIGRLIVMPESDALLNRWQKSIYTLLADTLGDAHAFVSAGALESQLRQRFWHRYSSLARSTKRIAVVAHSQGAALAHDSLKKHHAAPDLFVGVGSGLGVLTAARLRPAKTLDVAYSATAVLASVLAWFLIGAGILQTLVLITNVLVIMVLLLALLFLEGGLLALGWAQSDSDAWRVLQDDASRIIAILPEASRVWTERTLEVYIVLCLNILAAFALFWITRSVWGGPKLMRKNELRLPGLNKTNWLEFYSPLDPVSVGVAANTQATRIRSQNPTAWRIWREHNAYFHPDSICVAVLAERLAKLGNLTALAASGKKNKVVMRLRAFALATLSVLAWLSLYILKIY